MNELIRDAITPFFEKIIKKIDILESNLSTLNNKITNIENHIKIINNNCNCSKIETNIDQCNKATKL